MIRNTLILLYILAVLGFSAAARASILPDQVNYQDAMVSVIENATEYVGQVGVIPETNTYVLNVDGQLLTLVSTTDLSQFIGLNVMISGIEQIQQNLPGQKFGSVDPLPRIESGSNVFFVLSISEVIY